MLELAISSYFSSFKLNTTGIFFLGCWSRVRCSGAWKSTLLLTELTDRGSLPINMLHPTLKRFGQGQFRPLRPACSQNRAGTYNYAWSDFPHSVLFCFVVVVFCFLSKEGPGERGGEGGGEFCNSRFFKQMGLQRWICKRIGRFIEAVLLERMRFVIFRTRCRERSQRTSRPIPA